MPNLSRMQFRILYRQFLFRVVDLDLLSSHARGDASGILGQFAALLISASLIFCLPAAGLLGFPSDQPALFAVGSWSGEHFLIATTMLIVGLFAVLSWNSAFPDQRDVLILAPLPVRSRTMFFAKIAATGASLAIAIGAAHSLATLVWPFALNRTMSAVEVPALTSDPPIPPVTAEGLKAVMDRDLAGVPLFPGAGIVIGISKHGVRRVFSYGAARPDSLFEIGSVTKTMTALVLARMAARGEVRIDQPLRELLPEETVTKPSTAEITLADLATHHSGLPSMPETYKPAQQDNPFAGFKELDAYDYLHKRGVWKSKLADFLYSNYGFGLLGLVLSRKEGLTYAEMLEREVTGPLGLTDTVVQMSPDQRRRFLQGYNEQHQPARAFDLDAIAGAGAVRSTAGDMLTYLEANLHPERQPAELAAALREQQRPRANAGGGRIRIALSWLYNPSTGVYQHGGATAGHRTDAFFIPAADTAGIVLANTGAITALSADILGDHIRSRLKGTPAISIADVRIPATGGLAGVVRRFFAYWATMAASGIFIFGLVLAVQALAAQLPRRLFLRVSSFLQIGFFCILITTYLLQPMLATPDSVRSAQSGGPLGWSPSYWFLGLFQQLNGSPALGVLASRAWMALAIAVVGTIAAYLLSYYRSMRRIVEQPDIAPSPMRLGWLPSLGSSVQTAILRFSISTLLRSRAHQLVLGFYLGIGFGLVIFYVKNPGPPQASGGMAADPFSQASIPMLAATILMLGFSVLGTRAAFSLPLDLRANWLFRITPVEAGPRVIAARRYALFVIGVLPICAIAATITFSLWPWQQALGHTIVLLMLGAILVEYYSYGVQKIPFTCSYMPGTSNIHITFWLCIMLVVAVVTKAAEYERHALEDWLAFAAVAGGLAIVAAVMRWRTWSLGRSGLVELRFEEVPGDEVLALGL